MNCWPSLPFSLVGHLLRVVPAGLKFLMSFFRLGNIFCL